MRERIELMMFMTRSSSFGKEKKKKILHYMLLCSFYAHSFSHFKSVFLFYFILCFTYIFLFISRYMYIELFLLFVSFLKTSSLLSKIQQLSGRCHLPFYRRIIVACFIFFFYIFFTVYASTVCVCVCLTCIRIIGCFLSAYALQ